MSKGDRVSPKGGATVNVLHVVNAGVGRAPSLPGLRLFLVRFPGDEETVSKIHLGLTIALRWVARRPLPPGSEGTGGDPS